MSLIHTIIPPQAFEVVRDRIGRILTDEIDNQFQISYNPDFLVTSWIERFMQFNRTELPAINVTMAEGTYGGQTAIQSDGTYKYFIDAYVNAKTSDDGPGDVRAMFKLQRLLGVCRSILQDARYKTLGFGVRPGFIMSRQIESISIENPKQKEHDAMHSVMGRLVLSVKVPEITDYVQPTNLAEFRTSIKLSETELGYLWINRTSGYGYFDFAFDDYFE